MSFPFSKNGLKYFIGKYLMWPDSDDVFMQKKKASNKWLVF